MAWDSLIYFRTGTDLDEAKRNALYLFRYLLVFTAALESFAHGANDTANATAAFSATLGTYQNGLDSCDQPETPVRICVAIKFRAPHAIDAMLSP